MGGWKDARRQAIEEEVMGIFDRLGLKDQVHSINVTCVRSGSARIVLDISEDLGVADARKKQSDVIGALRTANPHSKIPGSEGSRIWSTPHRPPAERAKIRVIVSINFIDTYLQDNGHVNEIDWRGKLWVSDF